MYRKHFGLKSLPFENVPDPAFFFDEGEHARIRNRIAESLKAGRGLIVLSGPIGSGKTTMSQMIRADFSDDLKLIWMAEPPSNSIDLLIFIGQELGLSPAVTERTFLLRDIREALLAAHAVGRRCLLIIDESHLMNDESINTVRILNNLEEGSLKLIQILLLGQKELMETIARPEMEPFRQRIATLEMLGRMDVDRIRKYVGHRLRVAGSDNSIFADTGWDALDLAFGAGSTPRVINSLCDRSLSLAYERGKKAADAHDVYDVARGMGLGKDILDYIIALNTREREQKAAQPVEVPVEQKPVVETVPAVDTPRVINKAPMVEKAVAVGKIPVIEKAPVVEKVPAIEKTPVVDNVTVIGKKPAVEIKPEKPVSIPQAPSEKKAVRVQTVQEERPPEPVPEPKKEPVSVPVSAGRPPQVLTMPLLLLLCSLAAFAASILFYWQRSGIPYFSSALLDIVGLR